MDTQELLERFIDIIRPDVRDLGTNWDHIHFVCVSYGGKESKLLTDIRPWSESRGSWLRKDTLDSVLNLVMEWQKGASGAGAQAATLIVRMDRRDLDMRFFYGDKARQWDDADWRRICDEAEELFSPGQ